VIVDAHSDLLLELAFRREELNPFGKYWLKKLEQGGVRLQVCAVSADDVPDEALRRTLEQVIACHRAVRENSEVVALVRNTMDLDLVAKGERLGLMLAVEGAEPFGYDPEMADIFWELGARLFSLTWNRSNPFADGLAEKSGGGLSLRGAALVDRLAAHGAIIDLAHASERTYVEVLDRTEGSAVIVSHAGCRAVFDTPRNLSDDQLTALAERGGVLGVMGLPLTVDPAKPTVDRMVDHIDHAVTVMGVEHVGLGGDFLRQITLSGAIRLPSTGVGPDSLLPSGMKLDAALKNLGGPEDYPVLRTALHDRGYVNEHQAAIMGTNFLRIFREALPRR
jgi:membrane dipeptidase